MIDINTAYGTYIRSTLSPSGTRRLQALTPLRMICKRVCSMLVIMCVVRIMRQAIMRPFCAGPYLRGTTPKRQSRSLYVTHAHPHVQSSRIRDSPTRITPSANSARRVSKVYGGADLKRANQASRANGAGGRVCRLCYVAHVLFILNHHNKCSRMQIPFWFEPPWLSSI